MERDAFLERVRLATAMADPTDATTYAPGPLLVDLPPTDLVDEFTASLQRVDGVVHRAAATAEVAGIVIDILRRHSASSYVTWDELPVSGVVDAIANTDITRMPTGIPHDPAERVRRQAAYRDLTVGITGAWAGLSLSGSVVLATGNGRPRMASLIPLVHVALLDTRLMYRSLSHFVATHPTAARDSANLVVITGPSRTGDIEMKLNLGVHGPKHLHVVLYEE